MNGIFMKLSVCLVTLLLTQMLSVSARAGDSTLTFSVRNAYQGNVQLGFYSQDRPASWKYSLPPRSMQTFQLRCSQGELICLGASPTGDRNTGWGIGFDNNVKINCERCCYTCGGARPSLWTLDAPTTLNPN